LTLVSGEAKTPPYPPILRLFKK